jgi:hypothetical protein
LGDGKMERWIGIYCFHFFISPHFPNSSSLLLVHVISFEGLINPRLLGEVGDLVLSKGLQPIRTFDEDHYWFMSLILMG